MSNKEHKNMVIDAKYKAIHEITQSLNSDLQLDILLPAICKQASIFFRSPVCILRLLEEDSFLTIKASYGIPKNIILETERISIINTIAGEVINNRRPKIFNDLTKITEKFNDSLNELTSYICAPLTIGEIRIGTIALYKGKDDINNTNFTPLDLDTLGILATSVTTIIDNARLYKLELEKEEKILSLYWDVTQTKDYLKSVIDNSADAITISDTNGIIVSFPQK